jgi:hypothetical protein
MEVTARPSSLASEEPLTSTGVALRLDTLQLADPSLDAGPAWRMDVVPPLVTVGEPMAFEVLLVNGTAATTTVVLEMVGAGFEVLVPRSRRLAVPAGGEKRVILQAHTTAMVALAGTLQVKDAVTGAVLVHDELEAIPVPSRRAPNKKLAWNQGL